MSPSTEARAIITASYVLYFMNAMLDSKMSNRGSIITFRQLLLSKTRESCYLPYVKMSNDAWANTVNKFADKNYRLEIEDAIEFICMGEIDAMTEMFGSQFENIMYRMLAKLEFNATPKGVIAESRIIVKDLTAQTKKIVYDHFKDKA